MSDLVLVVTDRETGHVDLVHRMREGMARNVAPFTEDDDQDGHWLNLDGWAHLIARKDVDLSRVPAYRYGVKISGPHAI